MQSSRQEITMLKFPYAISNFKSLIEEHYYYADRSGHIALIEEAGKQLLFLRPRRFGKSLLMSMLEHYYDVRNAGDFQKLFGKLAIGQNPTPLHNQYLILHWDFSVVAPDGSTQEIRDALHRYLNVCMKSMKIHYAEILPDFAINKEDAIAFTITSLAKLSYSSTNKYNLYGVFFTAIKSDCMERAALFLSM
jgi:hypothetical protein